MRHRSALVVICIGIVIIAVLLLSLSVIGPYLAPTSLPAAVPTASFPKPKTLGESMCCLGQGTGYCAMAFHGEVNGVYYYYAASQKNCLHANVASEKRIGTNSFKQPDPDHCECKDYVFVPSSQLFKASINPDELLISVALEEKGLKKFIAPTEPLHWGDGTRLLDDFMVNLNDERWFRLFRIETWSEPETGPGGRKAGTKMLAQFGQELDPAWKPKGAQQATLVDTIGCLLKIKVGHEVFHVLTRGSTRAEGTGAKVQSRPAP